MSRLPDNMFREIHAPSVEEGKDEGTTAMAAKDSFDDCCVAVYIWLDAEGGVRAKTKTITKKPLSPDDCGIWMFDASATNQGKASESDMYLVPRRVFDDPFRGAPHVMVVCEVITSAMEPGAGNYRAQAAEQMEKYASHLPWFGLEQEYYVFERGTLGEPSSGVPMAGEDAEENAEYAYGCGGNQCTPRLRSVINAHYARCLAAGIKISGCNVAHGPGQGQYQIGPCRGLNAGDHMIASRFVMLRCGENHDLSVSFEPKPMLKISPKFHGSGMHVNFSSAATRGDNGIGVIEKCCRSMNRRQKEHLACYGDSSNHHRLNGTCGTCDENTFKMGIADRTASVRIPRHVAVTGKGHLEDRRPAANADPYRATCIIMQTAGEALNMQGKGPDIELR